MKNLPYLTFPVPEGVAAGAATSAGDAITLVAGRAVTPVASNRLEKAENFMIGN
jgi:hypothetical protein